MRGPTPNRLARAALLPHGAIPGELAQSSYPACHPSKSMKEAPFGLRRRASQRARQDDAMSAPTAGLPRGLCQACSRLAVSPSRQGGQRCARHLHAIRRMCHVMPGHCQQPASSHPAGYAVPTGQGFHRRHTGPPRRQDDAGTNSRRIDRRMSRAWHDAHRCTATVRPCTPRPRCFRQRNRPRTPAAQATGEQETTPIPRRR